MLKPIFDKDVNFFLKKKGGDFKNGALDSDFMFVNIEPYKSKKCVHWRIEGGAKGTLLPPPVKLVKV